MGYERLKDMFLAYVDNDVQNAESWYIRHVLEDVCGMTKEEAEELGLDWVFEEE